MRVKYRSEVDGSAGTLREKAMSPDGLMKSDGRVLLEEVVFVVSAACESAARHDDTGTIVSCHWSEIESLNIALHLHVQLVVYLRKSPTRGTKLEKVRIMMCNRVFFRLYEKCNLLISSQILLIIFYK